MKITSIRTGVFDDAFTLCMKLDSGDVEGYLLTFPGKDGMSLDDFETAVTAMRRKLREVSGLSRVQS